MRTIAILFFGASFLIAGCNNPQDKPKIENTSTQDSVNKEIHVGEVIDFMDAGDYTYIQLKENNNDYWIAIPKTVVQKGDNLTFSEFIEMKDFTSKTLKRTFETILFVQDVQKLADEETLKNAHSNVKSEVNNEIKLEPLKDGKTIAQIYKDKNSLNGKTIKVRGKVVKFNGGIMNRNWIHIQDGTDDNGNYDLLITSDESANVGDVIVAEGTLTTDKNFGAGYFYPVVVENAKIEQNK
ncbi:hypothetical protein BMS3Abin03_02956 [bacterium BMS3Abin03]|nr:hypothetical protein BMS3Abin03_02956 [bacterium BMS3Abin03]